MYSFLLGSRGSLWLWVFFSNIWCWWATGSVDSLCLCRFKAYSTFFLLQQLFVGVWATGSVDFLCLCRFKAYSTFFLLQQYIVCCCMGCQTGSIVLWGDLFFRLFFVDLHAISNSSFCLLHHEFEGECWNI
jgi:hypothetical protein